MSDAMTRCAAAIRAGRTALGIELGSTRIKACLIGDDPSTVLAVGSHEWENQFVDGVWTYSLDAVWSGLQAAYADLVADVERRYGVRADDVRRDRRLGDDARLPRLRRGGRAARARSAPGATRPPARAAAELTELFGVNIPLRWSIAHLHQAVLDDEPHVAAGALRSPRSPATCTGGSPAARCSASATRRACSRSTRRRSDYDADLLGRYDRLVDGTARRRRLARAAARGARRRAGRPAS